MFRRTAFAAAAALALVAPAALAAQTCQGFASFASGPVQAGAGASFADDVTVYGAGIGFGAASGGFLGGEIGVIEADIEDIDASGTVFGVSGGWQFPVGAQTAARALQVCPIAGFGYLTGDAKEGGVSVDMKQTDLSFGLSLGAAFTSSPALSIVPFGSASWVDSSWEIDSDFADADGNDSFGLLDLGVGFVANQWITIRPSIAIPFAESEGTDGDEVFSIAFAFNFGRSAR